MQTPASGRPFVDSSGGSASRVLADRSNENPFRKRKPDLFLQGPARYGSTPVPQTLIAPETALLTQEAARAASARVQKDCTRTKTIQKLAHIVMSLKACAHCPLCILLGGESACCARKRNGGPSNALADCSSLRKACEGMKRPWDMLSGSQVKRANVLCFKCWLPFPAPLHDSELVPGVNCNYLDVVRPIMLGLLLSNARRIPMSSEMMKEYGINLVDISNRTGLCRWFGAFKANEAADLALIHYYLFHIIDTMDKQGTPLVRHH